MEANGRFSGPRFIPTLGQPTTSLVGISNESSVYRSAGLNAQLYGINFAYKEYTLVTSIFYAKLVHHLTRFADFLINFSFILHVLRRFSTGAGTGPDLEVSRKFDLMEFRTVGFEKETGKVLAKAEFIYQGALPEISAVLAAEAAAVMLGWKKSGKMVEGGIVTPSTLESEFVEKIRAAGVRLEVGLL